MIKKEVKSLKFIKGTTLEQLIPDVILQYIKIKGNEVIQKHNVIDHYVLEICQDISYLQPKPLNKFIIRPTNNKKLTFR